MKKILLIGADGMLGGELEERLCKKYLVHGTTLQTLDICDRDAVFKKVEEIKPDFVINCAAFTNVDACETKEELALSVNGTAVLNIADAVRENDSTFIHISTDYVFPGDLDISKAYTEDMEPAPVSAYGRTKLVGEQNAAKAEKYYILRTAWLYGIRGKNFVKTMLRLSKSNDEVNVVDDQNGSPTTTTTLCEIIEKVLEIQPEYGIYHSTNEGFTTWCKFTRKIYEIAGIKTKVNAISSEKYKEMFPQSSDRPKNSKMSKEKLKSIGITPKPWEEALEEYMKEELK